MRERFRARLVCSASDALWENGALIVADGKILSVGFWEDLRQETVEADHDLGEVLLVPGLINAHCHLDYTHMAGFLPQPKDFPDWIKGIVSLKAHWNYTDFAASWLAGAKSSLAHGVTTVVDIEAVPELLPEAWEATPLRLYSLLELISIRSRHSAPDLVQQAWETIQSLPCLPGKVAGLSPHAPYTTSLELLHKSVEMAGKYHLVISTHVAESEPEFLMYTQADGSLYHWLKLQRPMEDCGHGSPVQHLERGGLLRPGFMAVHANYLAPGDAELLGRRGAGVVHCPRSHAYFHHAAFPFGRLRQAGVPVALGTDSLASVIKHGADSFQLSLFAELRQFAYDFPEVSAVERLDMVTRTPARMLGRSGELGCLKPGAEADFFTIPFARDAGEAIETLVHWQASVQKTFIAGKLVYPMPVPGA